MTTRLNISGKAKQPIDLTMVDKVIVRHSNSKAVWMITNFAYTHVRIRKFKTHLRLDCSYDGEHWYKLPGSRIER